MYFVIPIILRHLFRNDILLYVQMYFLVIAILEMSENLNDVIRLHLFGSTNSENSGWVLGCACFSHVAWPIDMSRWSMRRD